MPRERHRVTAADGTGLHAITVTPEHPRAAVILVHGVTMSIPFWERQIAALSDEMLVIAYDQRGHGNSERPGPAGITLDALGADLDAVMAQLVPDGLRVIAAGHSMGGISIMGWAARGAARNGRLDAAVLLNTTSGRIPQGAAEFLPAGLASLLLFALFPIARRPTRIYPPLVPALYGLLDTLAFGPDRRPEDLRRTVELFLRMHPRSRAAFIRFLEHLDARHALAGLDVPTLVVAGANDRLTPPAASGRIVELAPNARLHTLQRTGHQGPMEAADEVNRLIRQIALEGGDSG